MINQQSTDGNVTAAFNPLKIIIPVLLVMLAISLMAQWYASHVTLPRYCAKPEQALHNLDALLQPGASLDNDHRREYMVSARLLFLHPQQQNETVDEYKQRLRYLLLNDCANTP